MLHAAPGPIQVLSGDCVNGHGKRRIRVNGATYEGQWQNGLRHGKGTLITADGDMYEGDWREGKGHGTGKNYWSNWVLCVP